MEMKVRRRIIVAGVIIMAFALLPCLGFSGSLEPTPDAVDPSGNPVPTMKTLDEVLPAWSQKLRADDGPNGDKCNSSRFKCVLDGAAVLDKETGLVWERQPGTYAEPWLNGQWHCWTHVIGGRKGWRVPTLQELESLYDYCPDQGLRYLPCGHPFIDAQCRYWSATTSFVYSDQAHYFSTFSGWGYGDKNAELCFWCVRGGYGINVNE
jgi:hypothetical protein